MNVPALYLFAKDPDAAPVKTRLAAGLGPELATRFYRESLRLTLREFARLGEIVQPTVLVSPTSSVESFGERFGWPHRVAAQAEGGLGERLEAAFAEAAGPCMVVGTDMPELGGNQVRAACAALCPGTVVMGPCPDGGYYLLGTAEPHLELLRGMPWSTPDLQEATRARARELGLEVRELEPVADIDYLEDLQALDARLEGAGELGALVREILAEHAANPV